MCIRDSRKPLLTLRNFKYNYKTEGANIIGQLLVNEKSPVGGYYQRPVSYAFTSLSSATITHRYRNNFRSGLSCACLSVGRKKQNRIKSP